MEHIDPTRVAESFSYTALAKEVGATTKNIVSDEISILKTEVREIGPRAAHHSLEMIAFGMLASISVLPLLAFLVIGLGELLNHNYWLSSLIVAVVCAGIGLPLAYRSFKRLKDLDFSFSRTRRGLERSVDAVKETAQTIQRATKGNNHDSIYQH